MDDGNSYVVINIVTKRKDGKRAVVGRFYRGYGYKDKYMAGAGLNLLKDNRMLSVLAQSNNVNQYNFASGNDVFGAAAIDETASSSDYKIKELPGTAAVHSAGVNFSNKWISGNYFFYCVDNEDHLSSEKWNNEENGRQLFTRTVSDAAALNFQHRLNAKITVAPKSAHSVILRPEHIGFNQRILQQQCKQNKYPPI